MDINNYIQIKNSFGEEMEHEWVLLKGHISQKNKEDQTRDVSIVMNAVLITDENYNKVSELVTKHNDYTFGYIDNVKDHYLFEGEIPWCDLMPKCYSQNFRIMFNYRDVNKTKKVLKVLNNGKELTEDEASYFGVKKTESLEGDLEKILANAIKINLPTHRDNNNSDEITKKVAADLGYSATEIDVEYIDKENDELEISIDVPFRRILGSLFRNAIYFYEA